MHAPTLEELKCFDDELLYSRYGSTQENPELWIMRKINQDVEDMYTTQSLVDTFSIEVNDSVFTSEFYIILVYIQCI